MVRITVCPQAVKNLCSGGMLRKMGYGLILLKVPQIVRMCDHAGVLTGVYSENGMPCVPLIELLNLPDISLASEEVNNMHGDPLDLLHERCGHFSKPKLLEAHRHMLFTGTGLSRKHLSKTYQKELKANPALKASSTIIPPNGS